MLAPERDEHLYSLKFFCPRCNLSFADLDPRLFSFNSRHGACPTCNGMGQTYDFDRDLMIPDWRLSPNQGALDVYNGGPFKKRHRQQMLDHIADVLNIDLDAPLASSAAAANESLMYGAEQPQRVF